MRYGPCTADSPRLRVPRGIDAAALRPPAPEATDGEQRVPPHLHEHAQPGVALEKTRPAPSLPALLRRPPRTQVATPALRHARLRIPHDGQRRHQLRSRPYSGDAPTCVPVPLATYASLRSRTTPLPFAPHTLCLPTAATRHTRRRRAASSSRPQGSAPSHPCRVHPFALRLRPSARLFLRSVDRRHSFAALVCGLRCRAVHLTAVRVGPFAPRSARTAPRRATSTCPLTPTYAFLPTLPPTPTSLPAYSSLLYLRCTYHYSPAIYCLALPAPSSCAFAPLRNARVPAPQPPAYP
ncbi:hypothetical protein FB451DRAFT_1562115 [Mycena latifolia]|nr:hypothetical protein FB451DRAFT_1562115 [Mycena latifolia]